MGLMDFFKKGKEEPIKKKQSPAPARNVERPASTGPTQPPQRDYTIQPGDSLSKIAKRFYGNAGDWQRIYQANKDTIKNPDLIHPGQKIIIP